MDLEQLSKIHTLKEQGVISQAEFEMKKQELLYTPQQQVPVQQNNGNGLKTFLITLGTFIVFLLGGTTYSYITGEESAVFHAIFIIGTSIFIGTKAKKYEVYKYDAWYCYYSAFSYVILGILFWILAFPIGVYAILQVKSGAVPLKQPK